jgi:hypothetical protein
MLSRNRHCERSEGIQSWRAAMLDGFAALAMTLQPDNPPASVGKSSGLKP